MAYNSAMSYLSGTSYFEPANGAVKQVSMYFYRAGTLDPITVYTTSALAIPHAVPVLTTGYGRVPPIWLGPQPDPGYRIRVFDQYSTLVEDIDNIPVLLPPDEEGGGEGSIDPGDPRLYATGDVIMSMSNSQPRLGFVLCNGKNIAKTGSVNAPGGRANNDTQALFMWLWGQDLYGQLPVYPSRGLNASGDWDDGKGIAVPDFMGRSPVGMDAMGTAAVNRLSGVPMIGGLPAQMGARGGAAFHTLLTAEVPNHTHTLTDPGHQHYGVTPDHLHYNAVGVYSDSAHQHYVTGNTGYISHNHTHYYLQPNSAGMFYAWIASGASGTGAGAQTGGVSENHYHAVNMWSRAGDGAHYHTAWHSPAAADRSLAFWVDLRGTGMTLGPVGGVGGGGAHNNTGLFLALCFYIKL
jgi:hypothetical protein